MCQLLAGPPRGPFCLEPKNWEAGGPISPTRPEHHRCPSLRLHHLDPGKECLTYLPPPPHLSGLHPPFLSAKPVLTSCISSGSLQVLCPPRAAPGQLPPLYLPGPILRSASPPVKLTFPTAFYVPHVLMIFVSRPYIVLGCQRNAKNNKAYCRLFAWWGGEVGGGTRRICRV